MAQPTPADEGTEFLRNELLNLSIWESIESLLEFTYHSKHALALERRSEWFEQHDWPNYILYWVSAGHLPTEKEVKQRLDYLAHHGPTPFAFTFENPFWVQEILASDFEIS